MTEDDMQPVAHNYTDEQLDDAFGKGIIACSNGDKKTANPFSSVKERILYEQWLNGWLQYDADYNPDYYKSGMYE